jgi:hypothetical protein
MNTSAGVAARSRARGARISAVALEIVLWLVLALVVTTNVARPLLSPAMLGGGTGPYWGAPPSITARVSDSVWERAASELGDNFPEFGPGSVTGGPFERGESVEATLPNRADISVLSPMTFRQMVGVAGAEFLSGLVMAAAIVVAILIVRDLRQGLLFRSTNLRRVYLVAAVLGIGGMVAEVGKAWGRIGVLTSPRVADYVYADWTVSFRPLILALTIAVGAEILRLGMRLQRDVEGLV